MDLLALERKLKRSLHYPAKEAGEGEKRFIKSWELQVEGRLLNDNKNDANEVII